MSPKVVKEIVATFLKTETANVNSSTLIDNTAIPGSVLIHRMYSELSKKGFKVKNAAKVKTYGDLESILFNGLLKNERDSHNHSEDSKIDYMNSVQKNGESGIGIDIESVDNLPDSNDYFDDQFYIDNFSKKEIAYCSSKQNPKSCFCGRFAAKEAIVKADNTFLDINFSDIEIKVSSKGAPLFEGMDISISHLNVGDIRLSTAIAKKIGK
ncbi:4'-phosphopantetheinyl transferase superfamily protein [bacterium]|nr:4'-phosphopantetheinyl transferase superfamily protein [bacterium]